MKVALGGTFDPLHSGHKRLIDVALKLAEGGTLVVGVTSDGMARKRFRTVLPYRVRVENLRRYIEKRLKELNKDGVRRARVDKAGKTKAELKETKVKIEKIDDPFGRTLEEDFDYLVVSPETRATAERINEERAKRGMKKIEVVVVDWVIAKDGKPISSTRIKAGEIDRYGNVLEVSE